MSFDVWLLYVGTVLIFMSTPGPSHLLMLSVSMSNGFRRSLATAAGDLSANALQMMLAGLGLAAAVTASRHGFAVIKWAGVLYLVWIGVRQIAASFHAKTDTCRGRRASVGSLWVRGFVTSAANPKAVVFFAALFPQFLNTTEPLALQLAVLGGTYLAIDGCFLALYGKGANWIARRLRQRYRRWIERAAGVSLIAAAVLLGAKATQRH